MKLRSCDSVLSPKETFVNSSFNLAFPDFLVLCKITSLRELYSFSRGGFSRKSISPTITPRQASTVYEYFKRYEVILRVARIDWIWWIKVEDGCSEFSDSTGAAIPSDAIMMKKIKYLHNIVCEALYACSHVGSHQFVAYEFLNDCITHKSINKYFLFLCVKSLLKNRK